MPAISYRNLRETIIIIIFILLSHLSFAAVSYNVLKEEARFYREKGYEVQRSGDLDTAMGYYQKAVELDPLYAAAYNDLGVVYDIKGLKDRAEKCYLKTINLDPNYQSVYFNLANLYEEKGNFRKAADYWKKRIKIGDPNDPWTQKAKQRLANIGILCPDIADQLKYEETRKLMKDVSQKKDYLAATTPEAVTEEKEKKEKAKRLFLSAQANYSKGNFAAALKYAATAQCFDPSNSEIEKFVDKVRGKISAYSQ